MRSQWTKIWCGSPETKAAALSWFHPVCDGMTPEDVEILCDVETDREKKIRAVMVDEHGMRRLAIRTLGKKQYTIRLTEPLSSKSRR